MARVNRWVAPVAASVVVVAVGGGLVVRAQLEGEPCEATRSGDVVTIDLSTCEETTPSTSSPDTSAPSTSPTTPPSTAAPTTAPATSPTTEATSTTVAPTTTEPAATTTEAPATTSPSPPQTTSTTSPTTSTTQPPPSGLQFVEDFATPASVDRFDFTLFTGGHGSFDNTWTGDHNLACAGPGTGREVVARDVHTGSDPSPFVWWCNPSQEASINNGHLMTSLITPGPAILSFSPRQTFHDVTEVCWDVNATHLGGRHWMATVVVPLDIFEANAPRMDYTNDSDLTGHTDLGIPAGVARMEDLDGGHEWDAPDGRSFQEYGYFIYPDNADRYRRCITDNGNGTVTARDNIPPRPNPMGGQGSATGWGNDWPAGGVEVVTFPGSLPDGPVRVIFQDAQYDAPKAPPELPMVNGHGTTWHFDNIEIR